MTRDVRDGTVVLRRARPRTRWPARRMGLRSSWARVGQSRDGSLKPMEPTSNPDNTRSPRGLSRFWPGHREGEDPSAAPGTHEMTIAHPGEPQMVALGSRRLPDPGTLAEGGPVPVTPVHGTP